MTWPQTPRGRFTLGMARQLQPSLGSKAAPPLLWDQTGPFAPPVKEARQLPALQNPGPHCPGARGRGWPQKSHRDPLVSIPAAHSPQPTWTGHVAAAFSEPLTCPSARLCPSVCHLSELPLPRGRNGAPVRKGLPQPQSRRQWPLRRPPAPCPPCGLSGLNRPRGPYEQAAASGRSPPRSEPHTQAESLLKAGSTSLMAETFQASGHRPACPGQTDGQTDTARHGGFNF